MPRVILFKTPSEPSSADPYATALADAGYEADFVSVLQESFDTLSLSEVLLGAGGADYAGVIITSRRGAEGWIKAAEQLASLGKDHLDWSEVPLHTVGQTAIDTISSSSLPTPLRPAYGRDSRTAKSAEYLLPLLLALDPKESHKQSDRFLFVRGDKTSGTVQDGLRSAGKVVDEVEVYSTKVRPGLESDMAALDWGPPDGKVWLAFFSPSSSGNVIPHLPAAILPCLRHDTASDLTVSPASGIKVFAIGETTKTFLLDQGYIVHATAATPDARGLVRAIRDAQPPSPAAQATQPPG